jgi:predicted aspartyl protease
MGLLLAPSAQAQDACNLKRAAALDMSFDESGRISVPMAVGGQNINLLVDTGGIDSMLTEATVRTLGLQRGMLPAGYRVTVYGGTHIRQFASARDIVLGGLQAAQMRFLVIPDGLMSTELNGTLAPDVLRAYDDDFDFANAKLNLVSPDHCRGLVVYWTHGDYAQIEFATDDVGHLTIPTQLDGKTVKTDIDTGSSTSVFSLEFAESLFGIAPNSPDLKPLGGGSKAFVYPFKTLVFGGVTVINPRILLMPDSASRMGDDSRLILGMNVLRQMHMYVAYQEKKLYVTAASAH